MASNRARRLAERVAARARRRLVVGATVMGVIASMGVLGVGSGLTHQRSPTATRVHLRLRRFRVYQLLQALIARARTALAARALAYGETNTPFSGPIARGFSSPAPGKLTVAFDADKGGAPAGHALVLQLRAITQTTNASDAGFEVTADCTFS